MTYFGLFDQVARLNLSDLQEVDLYEGYFAEKYEAILGAYRQERDIYLSNAFCTDGPILEVACGTGRIMLDLAKKGLEVHGVDYSQDMLTQLEEALSHASPKVRKNITYEQGDAFTFTSDRKYGMAMIPATTICLLVDDKQKTIDMFNNIYNMLLPGGRFVFDYRTDQNWSERRASELGCISNKTEEFDEIILYQEFDNYLSQRSVVCFYAEQIYPTHTRRFLTSSSKRIVTEKLIQDILSHTLFTVLNEETVGMSNGVKVKFLVLEKRTDLSVSGWN